MMSTEFELAITEFAMRLMIKTKRFGSCSVSIGEKSIEIKLHQKTGEIELAKQYCDRALALAIELGIPLVKECEELKAQLENEP